MYVCVRICMCVCMWVGRYEGRYERTYICTHVSILAHGPRQGPPPRSNFSMGLRSIAESGMPTVATSAVRGPQEKCGYDDDIRWSRVCGRVCVRGYMRLPVCM